VTFSNQFLPSPERASTIFNGSGSPTQFPTINPTIPARAKRPGLQPLCGTSEVPFVRTKEGRNPNQGPAQRSSFC